MQGFLPNSSLFLFFVHILICGCPMLTWTFWQVASTKGSANDPEAAKQAFTGKIFFTFMFQLGLFALIYFVPDVPLWAFYAASIIPQVGGMVGVSLFVSAEMVGRGLGWGDLFWTADSTLPPLLALWCMLLLETFVCMKLAVSSANETSAKVKMPAIAEQSTPQREQEREEVDPTLKGVVSITNLGRAFAAKPKPVTALSDLNLSLYEGHITALLGQNGAGKTTMISILTGLFPPSEGDATIYGYAVSTAMAQIRKMSGVCPQHDLLLTTYYLLLTTYYLLLTTYYLLLTTDY